MWVCMLSCTIRSVHGVGASRRLQIKSSIALKWADSAASFLEFLAYQPTVIATANIENLSLGPRWTGFCTFEKLTQTDSIGVRFDGHGVHPARLGVIPDILAGFGSSGKRLLP